MKTLQSTYDTCSGPPRHLAASRAITVAGQAQKEGSLHHTPHPCRHLPILAVLRHLISSSFALWSPESFYGISWLPSPPHCGRSQPLIGRKLPPRLRWEECKEAPIPFSICLWSPTSTQEKIKGEPSLVDQMKHAALLALHEGFMPIYFVSSKTFM